MASREDSIYFARLAEQAERYEDMINYMKTVANVSLAPINTLWEWFSYIQSLLSTKLSYSDYTFFSFILSKKVKVASRNLI
jgi:hypothetical protein